MLLLTVYVGELKWNIETATIIIGNYDSKIDSLLAVSALHGFLYLKWPDYNVQLKNKSMKTITSSTFMAILRPWLPVLNT